MTLRATLALALGLGLALPGALHAQDGEAEPKRWSESRDPMPFDIIRSLQFLQDQVARGNDRAIRVQALLLRRFGPVFLDAKAEDWKDPRNQRAAVLFVLSGGPPEVLAGLLGTDVLPQDHRTLFDGALAYVRNDLGRAGELLGSLDLSGEEPGLAGHLNLVLGQIFQESDPAKAVAHLDQARLLAPGGLVEEAALRLETLLVDGLGDHERADTLARRYFDRYADSSYSGNFETRFAAMLSARGGDPDAAIGQMDDVIAMLPDARRGILYLSVGRRALVEGQIPFARLAAERAIATGALDARDKERARLYDLAASVAVLPAATLQDDLASLRQDRLHPEDLKLLAAALQTAAAIGTMPVAVPVELAGGEDGSSPVAERAERILGETRAALKSAVR